MIIPAYVKKILAEIQSFGYDAYLVGGCVRDFLLGKAPLDWDIATSALPDTLMEIFKDYKCVTSGIKHGTILVLTDCGSVEVTTFRVDGNYRDFRHPENVSFTQNLYEDLKRRDFTINTMAYSEGTGLVDPFCGKNDLQKKIIRCVGNPAQRFSEDALRILRALRFSAVLGFSIDQHTKDAIFSLMHLLDNISRERICSELSRLIPAPKADKVLSRFPFVFAHILKMEDNIDLLNANIRFLSDCPPDLNVRLAVLLRGLSREEAQEILKNLKFDKKTIHSVGVLVLWSQKPFCGDKIFLKTLLGQLGPETLKSLLRLKMATFPKDAPFFLDKIKEAEKMVSENICCSLKQLAVNGTDITTHLDIKGPKVGEVLNFLLDAVIKENCPNSADELLTLAKTLF